MNTNNYEIVKGICISNKKELMEFAKKYFDKYIFSHRVDNSLEEYITDGIDIRIGRYSRIIEEFTDPFDFPYGFFKEEIFVSQNDGELCIELIFPKINRYDNQKHIVTLSDMLCFLEENHLILTDDVPVISADTDFELGGSLTHKIYLNIYKNNDTDEEYVGASMYV